MVIWLLLPAGSIAGNSSGVSLTCKPDAKSFSDVVDITCQLSNGLDEPVLVPLQAISAEGPQESAYIYRYIAGERYEHVFQYERSSKGSLDKPILFKPTIHLSTQAIRDMRWVGQGAHVLIHVRWQPTPQVRRLGNDWKVRLKMIVARPSRLRRAFSGVTGKECHDLSAVLQRRVDLAAVTWNVRYRTEKDPWSRYDGCHDTLSEAFEHITSAAVAVRIVSPQRP